MGDEKTMDQERNLAAVMAWVDAYNTQDYDRLAELVTEDFRTDDPATGTDIRGRDAFGQIAMHVAKSYPNRRIGVTQLIPLGDSAVALEGVWDGTAAVDLPTGVRAGDARHRCESMLVELVEGNIALMRIYR
jgi:ketosteroid isomerase-like protein